MFRLGGDHPEALPPPVHVGPLQRQRLGRRSQAAVAGQGQEEIFSPEGGLQVLDYLWLLIPLAILAPLVEEIGFRGLLYGYMRGRTGVVPSIIVSSLVFAVLHIVIPPLFVMGAILAFLAERYRSIVPGIVLHATNNALVVVFIAIANTVE